MSDVKTFLDIQSLLLMGQGNSDVNEVTSLDLAIHRVQSVTVERTHTLKGGDTQVRGLEIVYKARNKDGDWERRDISIRLFADEAEYLKFDRGDISKAVENKVKVNHRLKAENEK